MDIEKEDKIEIISQLEKNYFDCNDYSEKEKIQKLIRKLRTNVHSNYISRNSLARYLGVSKRKLMADLVDRRECWQELLNVGFMLNRKHGFYPSEVQIIMKYFGK